MGKRRVDELVIRQIIELRRGGKSILEISQATLVPKTTVFAYIKDVEVLPEFKHLLVGKRGGSKKRKLILEQKAFDEGLDLVKELSHKERLLFLCALYWAEGNKDELILTNTDPEMIRIFTNGLREIFNVEEERIKISIRIYSDLDMEECLSFWSKVTAIPSKRFLKTYVLEGKKVGKLKYGMCRVRVLKGGNILKQIQGINKAFVQVLMKADKISG